MSSSACVVTSPMTTHRPFVIAVSQATRAWASCASMPSSTASETWSHTLSGWPSVTDSDVSRNEREALKDVATTTANHIGPGKPVGDSVTGSSSERLVLGRDEILSHRLRTRSWNDYCL